MNPIPTFRRSLQVSALVLATALAACGGGGDGATTAEAVTPPPGSSAPPPAAASFTHLAHDVDHGSLAMPLPPGVELGFDGLVVELR